MSNSKPTAAPAAGRGLRRPSNATVTADEVARIKRRLAAGEPPRTVAADFPLSAEQIRRIGRGEAWAWVRPARS